MLKRKLLVVAIGFSAVAFVGCGKNHEGSYRGIQTIASSGYGGYNMGYPQPQPSGQPSMPTNSATEAVTVTLNPGSGETIVGSLSSGATTGTIQGHDNGSGFDGVIVTLSPVAQQQNQQQTNGQTGYTNYSPYGYGSTAYVSGTMVPVCAGVFTGNLTRDDKRIHGTLSPQSPTMCGVSSITIDVTRGS